MYFKRLEMHGFKSFAEPATIEFHEGVTCIVGPNGSGKSNISDAIRWVLGEQSPKMLRGGKMEEVIFSGTASRKSRGMAEVTLVIDNTEGTLPIDYNEVAITRRMYRSGESEYLINNNQCRLRDIRELIMDTGIGVDGYSIIGQGKIADIVSSKPDSRREIFEEAAGVVMYKSKKAESERKLASATANLERVNDIISEIESRIDGLKEDSIKAEEYLKLKERFKELEVNITLKSIEKLEEADKIVKDDLQNLAGKIEELLNEKKVIEESLAKDRQKNENLEQLGNEARDKLLQKVEEINELTSKNKLDAERLNTIERDFARVQDEIELLSEKKSREDDAARALTEQKNEISKSIREVEETLREKINIYNEIIGRVSKLSEDIDENRNRMYSMYNEESAKRSEAKSMESYRESLDKRKMQIIEESQILKDSMEMSQKTLEDTKRDKTALGETLDRLETEIQSKKDKLANILSEENILDKKISHLQIQMSQFNTRKKTIEEMENNYEGYNAAVRFIMKEKLSGIEGVAADLMSVPKGLEVAIETALGPSMQNIVCKKDQDAKAAVNVLKDNRAGRATFLPIESIRGSKVNLPDIVTSARGFRGLACDLIKFDSKHEGIFKYLLGRAAVVDTMQDAIDLSKVAGIGLRFVTTEGEIVNAGGAITGGRYKNATANLLERKGEIVKLGNQISDIESQLETIQRKRQEFAEHVEYLNKEIYSDDQKMRAAELELTGLDARINSAVENSREVKENAARHEQMLAAIDRDLENAISMTQKLESDALICQKEAENAKNAIESLMKEHESIKEMADKASDEITAARIEKNRIDSTEENITGLLKRVYDSLEEFEEQIKAKKIQIEEFEQEKHSLIFGTDDSEEKTKLLISEKEGLEEYITQVSAEKADLSVKVDEMSKKHMAMGENLNAYQDQKYQQEIKLAKNETQLDTFKEKLWDEFEISYLQAMEFKKDDFAMSTAQKESREIKSRLRELGDVNVGAIQEYAQVKERYEFLSAQKKDITSAMDQLQAIVDDMEKTIKTKFKENFDKVVINFEEIFKTLFGGGHAELRLDNEDNPLESGIEIVAQPPGKKLQNINLMSGGEKTMTAIALMFAVLKTTPTPFCILDEVEAALDDHNIDRFANYLRNFRDIQFAIVTHQKTTMEHADVLYGVTMPEQGISKVLSLRLGDNFDLGQS